MSLLLILLAAAQPADVAGSDEPAPASINASVDASANAAEIHIADPVIEGPTSVPGADANPGIAVPKLTPIEIEVLAPLGSKLSKTGDMFPIRLAKPIMAEGIEVVPAGTGGMGEVIFAKKSGGMGAAGELVVTARYLEVNGRRLPLRSMHFMAVGETGQSKVDTVNSIAVASAATFAPVAFIGFFIGGGQVNVAPGTLAEAKTAEEFISPVQAARAQATEAYEHIDEVRVEDSAASGPPADSATISMGTDTKKGNGE